MQLPKPHFILRLAHPNDVRRATQSSDLKMPFAAFLAFALFAGCVSTVHPAASVRLGITTDRYVVDGTELVSAEELRSYLVTHAVREARVIAPQDVPYARVAEAVQVLQGLGIDIGIVGHVQY